MITVDTILRVAAAYEIAAGVSAQTVSWRVFGDSKKLTALRGGADLHTRRAARALAWFQENWPADAAWPDGVQLESAPSNDLGSPADADVPPLVDLPP